MKGYRTWLAIFFTVLILAASSAAVFGSVPDTLELFRQLASAPRGSRNTLESYMLARLPLTQQLRELALRVKIAGGMREEEGLFFTEEGLIEDLAVQGEDIADGNTEAIAALARSGDTATYLMLIPTACAIYQEQLPETADLYDQKSFIENTYRSLSGTITTVDVYPSLFAARDDYLYYRTESALTSLGGFEVYETLARRLGNTPRQLSQFSISTLESGYYGDLYWRWNSGGIKPDIITAYRELSSARQYRVEHRDAQGSRVYYSLYPKQARAAAGSSALDCVLGGASPIVDIVTSAYNNYNGRLLVFCDAASYSFLPMLATHYGRITCVDASALTDELAATLDFSGYDQILFAYSLSGYMLSDAPAIAAELAAG